MKLNITTLTIFVVGAVLIYSAAKNMDPRDMVRELIGIKTEKRRIAVMGYGYLKPIPGRGDTPQSYSGIDSIYVPGV